MAGQWLTVVNPDIFMTYCAECARPFKKGSQVQRIEGGYGYRCERCGEKHLHQVIREGIAEAERGETVDLGSFAQYGSEEE